MQLNYQAIPTELLSLDAFIWALILLLVLNFALRLIGYLTRKIYYLSIDRVYWGFGLFKSYLTNRVEAAVISKAKYKSEERLVTRGFFYATLSMIVASFFYLVIFNLLSINIQFLTITAVTNTYPSEAIAELGGYEQGVPNDISSERYFALIALINVAIQLTLSRTAMTVLELVDIIKETNGKNSKDNS